MLVGIPSHYRLQHDVRFGIHFRRWPLPAQYTFSVHIYDLVPFSNTSYTYMYVVHVTRPVRLVVWYVRARFVSVRDKIMPTLQSLRLGDGRDRREKYKFNFELQRWWYTCRCMAAVRYTCVYNLSVGGPPSSAKEAADTHDGPYPRKPHVPEICSYNTLVRFYTHSTQTYVFNTFN